MLMASVTVAQTPNVEGNVIAAQKVLEPAAAPAPVVESKPVASESKAVEGKAVDSKAGEAKSGGPAETDLIRRPAVGEAAGGAGGGGGGVVRSSALYETGKVVGSLALVLAAIVGLKMFATKVLGIRAAGGKMNRGIQVLSRTLIGGKQQLLLLQVGRKLVLVADSGGKISPVTEITDPDEVAELAAQALGNADKAARFSGAFRGNAARFEVEGYDDEMDMREELPAIGSGAIEPNGAEDQDGLSSLSARVRALGRQFKAT